MDIGVTSRCTKQLAPQPLHQWLDCMVARRAGDLMKSMQVLVYKAEDGVLEVCIYAGPY